MKEKRPRVREGIGIEIGILPTGRYNAITDVPGVRVGQVTLIEGQDVRTGLTAILPHGEDLYREKVTGAVHVINGFGKSLGLPQVIETGYIETPILLTGTLNVWRTADALVSCLLERNPDITSINPVVGECNDSYLNNIAQRPVGFKEVKEALENASSGEVAEGNAGAGCGMQAFGFKAGVGTSSRKVKDYTLGVLVVCNTGLLERFCIDGIPVGREFAMVREEAPMGSIMIILGTDAPATPRELERIAKRAGFGLARAGGTATHQSGDFVIAFSNADKTKIASEPIPVNMLDSLFGAAVDATEEAIINSVLRATDLTGNRNRTRKAIPIKYVMDIMSKYGRIKPGHTERNDISGSIQKI